MPLLGTKGAASAQGFGLFGMTAAPDVNFISYTNNYSSPYSFTNNYRAVAGNNAGYIAVSMNYSGTTGSYAAALMLLKPDGSFGFLRRSTLSSSNTETTGWSVCMDSDNIYWSWAYINPGAAVYRMFVSAVSITTGNFVWHKEIGLNYNNGARAPIVVNGATGELVIAGRSESSGFYVGRMQKSNGGLITSYTYPGWTFSGFPGAAYVASQGVYVCSKNYVFKLATNLATMTAVRTINEDINTFAALSDGRVALGINYSSQTKVAVLASTLTTVSWTRLRSSNVASAGLAVDSSNNVYVQSTGGDIEKLNSSGTLQFSRTLNGSYGTGFPALCTIDSQYCGILVPSNNIGAFKLPLTGTGTGTYGLYTYGTGSTTYSSSSLSTTAATVSSQNSGFSLSTPTLSFASDAATVTKFTVA